jgi:hypothetical protein
VDEEKYININPRVGGKRRRSGWNAVWIRRGRGG